MFLVKRDVRQEVEVSPIDRLCLGVVPRPIKDASPSDKLVIVEARVFHRLLYAHFQN